MVISMHYICEGDCGGVSNKKKNCGAEDCTCFDEPLTACSCSDGKHG
ncbi:MAG TPA: hypothetical protein VJK72_03015 [Candidatus Nanoarchaeia archaeon]|nr:hypothetical protein [Candidatus Nanoarchaeia archaeon]